MAAQTARRTYVTVNSEFDPTGYMQPRSITWKDGRTFPIDAIRSFRPAVVGGRGLSGDCYTVVIRGEVRFLYFERSDARFTSLFGRWFVEQGEDATG